MLPVFTRIDVQVCLCAELAGIPPPPLKRPALAIIAQVVVRGSHVGTFRTGYSVPAVNGIIGIWQH